MKRASSDSETNIVKEPKIHACDTTNFAFGETVSAKFYDDFGYSPHAKHEYFEGIVAQQCSAQNAYRYLIFFHDGYAQYTPPNHVKKIRQPKNPWDLFDDEEREIVKDFVRKNHQHHLVSLEIGNTFKLTTSGKQVKARVEDIDGLLFKIRYPSMEGMQYEWIYRGNFRIDLIMEHFDKLSNDGDFNQTKAIDDKKTSKNSHACSNMCVTAYNKRHFTTTNLQFRRENPINIPIQLGFIRETVDSRTTVYRTPCRQLALESYAEIQDYITKTCCEIPMEFFCLQSIIRDNGVFSARHSPKAFIRDISNGRENFPVSFHNSITTEAPTDFVYHSEVFCNKNKNNDLIIKKCCDCIDGCQDKTRCKCRKRSSTEDTLVFGRLQSRRANVLYECNESCTSPACTNRLIEKGPIWPVEIFKTATTGFGVRALVDIPVGSFVACFTGDPLSNEKSGNFTAFMNKSHCPNLLVQKVGCDRNEYIQLALFTKESVMAGEELTVSSKELTDNVRKVDEFTFICFSCCKPISRFKLA